MPRRVVGFLSAFLCVFAGLALVHGPGPYYSKAHAAVGNLIVGGQPLASGVRLHFEASDAELAKEPWRAILRVESPQPGPALTIPVDLRSLLFLPTAAFIALAIAAPLHSTRAHLQLLALGLLILEPLLLLLVALPILSFLGGTGPILAFTLSRPTHVVLQLLHRALVAPPGMAYAVPLLLWWLLVVGLNRSGAERAPDTALTERAE